MPRVLLMKRSRQRHHFEPPERDRQIDAQPPADRFQAPGPVPARLRPRRGMYWSGSIRVSLRAASARPTTRRVTNFSKATPSRASAAGLQPAFIVGGVGEALGAVAAFIFIRRDSLYPVARPSE
jgi:hypothetical protein